MANICIMSSILIISTICIVGILGNGLEEIAGNEVEVTCFAALNGGTETGDSICGNCQSLSTGCQPCSSVLEKTTNKKKMYKILCSPSACATAAGFAATGSTGLTFGGCSFNCEHEATTSDGTKYTVIACCSTTV